MRRPAREGRTPVQRLVTLAAGEPVSPRLRAAFCVGCRRVDAPALCPQGCDEQAVELVFGDDHDTAVVGLEGTMRDARATRRLLGSVASTADPGAPELRELRARARSLVSQVTTDSARREQSAERVVRITAGHCPQCGWIEAPQPCLGVCLFRAVEMVPAGEFDDVWTRGDHARRELEELVAVARQLAWVTPRAGEEGRTWAALVRRARDVLTGAGPDPASVVPPRP